MINPTKVIKALKQRHPFIMNHPELFSFISEFLTNSVTEGTELDIKVNQPNGEESKVSIIIQESDIPFLEVVKEVLEKDEE